MVDQRVRTYLQTIPLLSLTPEARTSLETLINRLELLEAMTALKPAKSPGPDGLLAEFYHQFSETVVDRLLEVYNEVLEREDLPGSMNYGLWWSPGLVSLLLYRGDPGKPRRHEQDNW
ncbi:hypothetical protein NDU88_005034 [Pleurodeles waltl]|uniref:Uncharacterized protein n=1 Tax=Pleurodeles waltl TaxID=8319 RepID=A0AAV7V4Q1_PLEWA|nr:hypothetical protein NDU88_005034 [Pleurodeles waltl]